MRENKPVDPECLVKHAVQRDGYRSWQRRFKWLIVSAFLMFGVYGSYYSFCLLGMSSCEMSAYFMLNTHFQTKITDNEPIFTDNLLTRLPEIYTTKTLSETIQDYSRRFFRKSSGLIQIYDTRMTDHENTDILDSSETASKTPQPLTIPLQNTCALVGNSGILVDSNCGEDINQFDLVFRSNLAAIKGYEKDVGDKLNITSINRHALEELVKEITLNRPANQSIWRDSFLERLRFLNGSVLWYTLYDLDDDVREMLQVVEEMNAEIGLKIKIAYSQIKTGDFVKRIWGIGDHHVPTTGLIICTLAATICENITLYGYYPFHRDQSNKSIKYHYFDNQKIDHETSDHNMPEEFRIF